MRDWTPLTPPHLTTTQALAVALKLIELATGSSPQWNERQSWLSGALSEELRLVLHVPKFTWQIVDARDRKKARLAAANTTLADGKAWLTESLHTLGLPPLSGVLDEPGAVVAEVSKEDAEVLLAWLASAHQVLALLAGTDPGWSSVVWRSTPLGGSTTHASSGVVLALELAGPHREEPAFTVKGPSFERARTSSLVSGQWSPVLQGAVLSASDLDAVGQREQIVSFVADALAQLQP